MQDKFGREIVVETIGDKKKYTVAGKFSVTLDADDETYLAKIEAQKPGISDYASTQCDFGKYASIVEPDFEGSTYGGELVGKFFGDKLSATDEMRKKIFKNYNTRMDEMFSLYPRREPETWSLQAVEAVMWSQLPSEDKTSAVALYGNPLCPFTLIFSIALKLSGALNVSTVDELVLKIATNGFLFKLYGGELTGYKAKLCVQLAQANTIADLIAIDVDFAAIVPLMERI